MLRFKVDAQRRAWIRATVAFLAVATCLILNGCNGDSSNNTGTVRVTLTDIPACGYEAVNVTISQVRIHQSSSAAEHDPGWSDISLDPPRQINLLDLTNGALEELGQVPLAAGHYTQLRLVLVDNSNSLANSIVPAGTSSEVALDTPSAMQSGLKLIHPFDVTAGERVDLTLDFDACKSIVTTGSGKYLLKPVVRVVPFILNGIGGFIDPALLADQVTISAQNSGNVVRATVPDPLTGEFFLARFAPGTYDVVITADDHATAVVSEIPVPTATSSVMLSTGDDPLTLPTSATHIISGTIILNPLSTTAVAEAIARQTFPAGPTVTVQARNVDLLDNSYNLTLSIAAPLLGSYGSGTLPLAFTAQSALAGQYTVSALASGYQPQSVTRDIATADATADFVLIP